MKVSILITVYNAEKYIYDCIDSIINQTYKDFEVIIINDGSTDKTSEILSTIKDQRFVIVHRTHNYIASLNYGLKISKGAYIARMDADDVMLPNRIEEQVRLMDSHPEVDACGTWSRTFGNMTFDIRVAENLIVCPIAELLIKNIFTHPTMMLRKEFLIKNNLKYKNYSYAEDYKLWVDMAQRGGTFWIIPKILLHYRLSEKQVSNIYYKEQVSTSLKIRNEVLLSILNDKKCNEIEALQNIYIIMSNLNAKQKLSAENIRNIIYIIYNELMGRN